MKMKMRHLCAASLLALGVSNAAFAVEDVNGTSLPAPECKKTFYYAPEGVLSVPYVDVAGEIYSAELVHPNGNALMFEVVPESIKYQGPAPQTLIATCQPNFTGAELHLPRMEMLAIDAMGNPSTVAYESTMYLDPAKPGLVFAEKERMLIQVEIQDQTMPAGDDTGAGGDTGGDMAAEGL